MDFDDHRIKSADRELGTIAPNFDSYRPVPSNFFTLPILRQSRVDSG
jgi:hypothetical protein